MSLHVMMSGHIWLICTRRVKLELKSIWQGLVIFEPDNRAFEGPPNKYIKTDSTKYYTFQVNAISMYYLLFNKSLFKDKYIKLKSTWSTLNCKSTYVWWCDVLPTKSYKSRCMSLDNGAKYFANANYSDNTYVILLTISFYV